VQVPIHEVKKVAVHPKVESFYSFAYRMCPVAFLEDGAKFFTIKASARGKVKLPSCPMPSEYVDHFIGKSSCYKNVNMWK